jgi:predicted ATPase
MKIVFTGGPCSGKSTCLNYFKEKYNCYEEIAAKIILKNLNKNNDILPWIKPFEFQLEVFKEQSKLEEKINKENHKIHILDRALYDNLAYLKHHKIEYKKPFNELINKKQIYDLVFIFEPLNFSEINEFRKEEKEEQIEIHNHIIETYKKYQIDNIYFVPLDSIENRINYIKKILNLYNL